ncbi:class I SAM-dependent methyltransferase [Methanotorris formicicus]|uniref:Methyltransferase small n=1 Tax=Methanotorris formicicus Mc-S-70 TaxID=647171 RepID=H1L018_9EURY|nr:class I SAM-dependent methyltransferase [Methanotorris formicicus]EHP85316.1 methyltransferase small [Methanotorris formicicus Mc-S-70]
MHYFSEKPTSKHDVKIIEDVIRGKHLIFKTDSGIFSPNKVDKGTKLLAEEVEVDKDDDVLDLGCGYGVIGITLADEVNSVVMTDINRRAIKLAKENIKLNNLEDLDIEVYQGDLYENVKHKKYDIIVSNPPIKAGKKVIHRIIEEGKELLKDNGSLWVVIQTKHGAKSLAKFMGEVFGNVETVTIKGGYRILKSVKE